jgi:hypothetical protein
MKSELYRKVEQFVIDASKEGDIKHFRRTVYWIKQLKPDADEALLISGITHDIERAFRGPDYYKKWKISEIGFRNEEFLRYHSQRGAEIIVNFLKSQGAGKELIEKVKMLVSRHEIGGDDEQNILKDADSISFFENNVDSFFPDRILETGAEKVKEKFDWMFDRITSEKAKEIVRPWYEDAIKRLHIP